MIKIEQFVVKKLVLSILLLTGIQQVQATLFSSLFNMSLCIVGISNIAEVWLGAHKNPFKTNVLTIEKRINNKAEKTTYALLPNIGMKTEKFSDNQKISEIKYGFWLNDNNDSSAVQTKVGCSILPIALIAYGLKQLCNR